MDSQIAHQSHITCLLCESKFLYPGPEYPLHLHMSHGVMEDSHKDYLVGASEYQMNHEEQHEIKPAGGGDTTMNSDMNDTFMAKINTKASKEDGFNGFTDAEIPSWVCDDFKNVDLKTGFQIRPTFYVSMRRNKTLKTSEDPSQQLADEAKENPQAPPPPVGDSKLVQKVHQNPIQNQSSAPASLPSKKASKPTVSTPSGSSSPMTQRVSLVAPQAKFASEKKAPAKFNISRDGRVVYEVSASGQKVKKFKMTPKERKGWVPSHPWVPHPNQVTVEQCCLYLELQDYPIIVTKELQEKFQNKDVFDEYALPLLKIANPRAHPLTLKTLLSAKWYEVMNTETNTIHNNNNDMEEKNMNKYQYADHTSYPLGTITLDPVEQEEDSGSDDEYETTTEGRILLTANNITMLVPGGDGPEGKE